MPAFLKKKDESPVITETNSKETNPELNAEYEKTNNLSEKIKGINPEKVVEFFKKYSLVLLSGGATIMVLAWISKHPEDADKVKDLHTTFLYLLTGAGVVTTGIGAVYLHDTEGGLNKEVSE